MIVLPRFYCPIEYDGTTYSDDRGEVFSSLLDAEAYAGRVANELARNNTKALTVSLVDEDGALLIRVKSVQRMLRDKASHSEPNAQLDKLIELNVKAQ